MGSFIRFILMHGWAFVVVYGLTNRILLAVYPRHFSQRYFARPLFLSRKQYYSSVSYTVLLNATLLYLIFLPISFNPRFYIGATVFSIFLLLYILALTDYASTPPEQPVTKGIYRLSRHPQQVLTELILMGGGLAAGSWIIIFSCIVQLLLLYQSMEAQEKYCIEKYGRAYQEYIKNTPRYFLLF